VSANRSRKWSRLKNARGDAVSDQDQAVDVARALYAALVGLMVPGGGPEAYDAAVEVVEDAARFLDVLVPKEI
jgi:hypothetical protein